MIIARDFNKCPRKTTIIMGVVVKESLSLVALWSYTSLVFGRVIMPLNGTKVKTTTKSTMRKTKRR